MKPLKLNVLLEQFGDERTAEERRDQRYKAVSAAARTGKSWDRPFQSRVRRAFTRASRRFAKDKGKPTFYSLSQLRQVPTTDPI